MPDLRDVYNEWIPRVIQFEGGYVNNTNDAGGATNKGVIWKTFKSLSKIVLGKDPDFNYFKNSFSVDDAKKIARWFYDNLNENASNPISANQFKNNGIRLLIAETHWGSGAGNYHSYQKAANRFLNEDSKIVVDGFLGPATVRALNSIQDQNLLFHAICEERLNFFDYIVLNGIVVEGVWRNQSPFGLGWMRRLRDNYVFGCKLNGINPYPEILNRNIRCKDGKVVDGFLTYSNGVVIVDPDPNAPGRSSQYTNPKPYVSPLKINKTTNTDLPINETIKKKVL